MLSYLKPNFYASVDQRVFSIATQHSMFGSGNNVNFRYLNSNRFNVYPVKFPIKLVFSYFFIKSVY